MTSVAKSALEALLQGGPKVTRARWGVVATAGLLATIGALFSTGVIPPAAPTVAPPSSSKVVGDAVRGKQLFTTYCSGCHTLKAARASGRVGPNLDEMKPSYARVVKQVTNPRLPPGLDLSMLTFFPGTFTESDIRDIAAFVFMSTHA